MTTTTPEQLTAEAISGLKGRFIPRLNSAEAMAGANDFGDHFRCQLGKTISRPEGGVLPGMEAKGEQRWIGEYFICSYFGATWEDVIRKVTKGERVAA